jgi:hypothetical protein
MTDILDHTWDNWCHLCQEAHWPCEVSDEWGHDIFATIAEPVENGDG